LPLISFLCVGPNDIGAVGVAIAIFNQLSRITMYPIVSITTSFVAEEDTMERLGLEAEAQKLEANKLENLEEGATPKNGETEVSTPKNGETKVSSPKNGALSLSLSLSLNKCRKKKKKQ
jgi:hypothetical protein